MDYLSELSDVNYLAVLFAVLSTLILGFIWYSMAIFGTRWAGLVGLKKKDMENQKGMGLTFGLMIAGAAVSAIMLSVFMQATSTRGFVEGATMGFLIGIAFRVTAHIMHNGFARRNHELTVIDGMHDAIQLAIMGAIIGGFL